MVLKEKEQKGSTPINIYTFQDPQCLQRLKNKQVAAPPFFINYILYVSGPKLTYQLLFIDFRTMITPYIYILLQDLGNTPFFISLLLNLCKENLLVDPLLYLPPMPNFYERL